MYKNKNVLVTGGSGVIGSVLIQQLVHQGANVRNVDFTPQPQSLTDLGVEQIQVDLSNPNSQFLFRFEPEYVFHLAADFERSTETKNFWDSNWKNNILASRYLIEKVIKFDSLKKIIFASSYLIYDKELYSNPIKPKQLSEKDNINPRNLCGLAKLQTETDIEFLSHFYNVEIVSARIYRVYGKNDRTIIPRWIRDLLKGKKIKVFDENNSFDYIFSDDIAEGLLKLGSSNTQHKVYNLGSGVNSSISDVLKILGKKFPKMEVERTLDSIQPEGSYADMSRMETEFGWIPKISLEEGIEKIIEHENG